MKVLNYIQERVSCAHRYARRDWCLEKNKEVYGADYSENGMGHNLGILACGSGDLRSPLGQLCACLDHEDLNKVMGNTVPTVESIAKYSFETILEVMEVGFLEFVQVQEGDFLWASYNRKGVASLTKVYGMSCLHRHYNPNLSKEENKSLYGKCFNLHGHEYKLEVSLVGDIDAESHLICRREWMDSWVHGLIIKPYNKQFLNEFMDNASGELIIQHFYDVLNVRLPRGLLLGLCLRETRKNSFFIKASDFIACNEKIASF